MRFTPLLIVGLSCSPMFPKRPSFVFGSHWYSAVYILDHLTVAISKNHQELLHPKRDKWLWRESLAAFAIWRLLLNSVRYLLDWKKSSVQKLNNCISSSPISRSEYENLNHVKRSFYFDTINLYLFTNWIHEWTISAMKSIFLLLQMNCSAIRVEWLGCQIAFDSAGFMERFVFVHRVIHLPSRGNYSVVVGVFSVVFAIYILKPICKIRNQFRRSPDLKKNYVLAKLDFVFLYVREMC